MTSLKVKKIYNDSLLVNPFSRFFRQLYELVIYIHTNEQDGEQTDSTVNFSDNSDLRQGFKASLRDF